MITQARLKELFSYDPETGLFTRIIGRRGVAAGSIAGTVMLNGYIKISIDHKQHYAHRLAWLWINGLIPDFAIDHVNGNRQDNRIANLRPASMVENLRNMKIPVTNKSGVKGVCWHKGMKKWHVQLRYDGRQNNLGFFDELEDARKCVDDARRKHHKEFARSI